MKLAYLAKSPILGAAMNVQSHSSFQNHIFYMNPIIYKPSPLQSAEQNIDFALDFSRTADKFLVLLDVSPQVRKNIQIAITVVLGAAIVAALVKAISK